MQRKIAYLLVLCLAMTFLLGPAALASEQNLTATEFRSNGDLNSGWYWLRDQALQQYAEWTFVGIPKDMEGLAVFNCTDRVASQCCFSALPGAGLHSARELRLKLPRDNGNRLPALILPHEHESG